MPLMRGRTAPRLSEQEATVRRLLEESAKAKSTQEREQYERHVMETLARQLREQELQMLWQPIYTPPQYQNAAIQSGQNPQTSAQPDMIYSNYLTYGGLGRLGSADYYRGANQMMPVTYYAYGVDTTVGAGPAQVKSEAAAVAVVEAPSREMLKHQPIEIEKIDFSDPIRQLAMDAESVLGYGVMREKAKMPSRLRQVLADLEIEVLDQTSVDAYKEQMVEHYDTAKKMEMPTWRLTKLKDYKKPVPEFAISKAVQIKKAMPEAEFYIDQLAIDPFLIVVAGFNPVDYSTNQPSRYLPPDKAAYIDVWDEPKFESELLK